MTPPTAARDRPDSRGDSCYFPGCRKDANCHCEICLASINATLDLIPSGSYIQQSSLTNLSSTRPKARRALRPESPPATPETGSSSGGIIPRSPLTKSTAKSRLQERKIRKKRSWVLPYKWLGVLLLAGLWVLRAVDFGVFSAISRDFGPKLKAETVNEFAEGSISVSRDVKERLMFLQRMHEGIGLVVSDCSSMDSNWEFVQDAHIFFHWRCVMYQSLSEKVSIWGSPLRTSGLLPTGYFDRSLTLLSGRITEWSRGRPASVSRTSNSSSWTSQAWNLVAIQLEEGTWVVEYQRSFLFHGPDLITSASEMLKIRVLKAMKAMEHLWKLLLLPALPDLEYHRLEEASIMHPT